MWGMIPYIVEADKVGTAYGIVVSCQNLGTFLMPLLMSYIHDNTSGSQIVDLVFIVFSIISFGFKIMLYRWDQRKRGGILQSRTPARDF
jgi:nitrate/nitrite transporter NarK